MPSAKEVNGMVARERPNRYGFDNEHGSVAILANCIGKDSHSLLLNLSASSSMLVAG